jgi:two-component system, chemotaxis family, CheB/CheR fusion protein
MVMLARAGNGQTADELSHCVRLREAALDASPVAQVLIDPTGRAVLANEKAKSMFELDPRDIGRPLQDLVLSYRPVELRSMIERAVTGNREVWHCDAIRPLPDGREQYLDIRVRPLRENGRQLLGTAITFEDVTERHQLQEEIENTKQELETAYEELHSTNEELETTNEELQSTVEELQTTNEELQSTNEEMETMNEELHSTNDELREMNTELRQRTIEAQQANAFLASILARLDAGVVVLGRDMEVLLWNERAEDLWGLRAGEVQGRSFLTLDIGLPVRELEQAVRTVLAEEAEEREMHEITLQARNRRGRDIQCRVRQTVRLASDGEAAGVVLLMEEV